MIPPVNFPIDCLARIGGSVLYNSSNPFIFPPVFFVVYAAFADFKEQVWRDGGL
jgi:hypothetical protein